LAEEDEFNSTNSLSFLPKRNKSPPKLSKRQVSYQKAQKLLKESQRKVRGLAPLVFLLLTPARDLVMTALERIGS
jgi:hypothetical protein